MALRAFNSSHDENPLPNTTYNPRQSFSRAEFGEFAILVQSGKPYFPATECARILGYKNPQKKG
ncbi:MAG: hypothetical protein LBO63_06895 [Oscillospiraceae bacterium]|jgi:prophage antirepressor-like protein|nr:hypothetical protein [Oscillospiraceae bacterium]